MRTERKSRAKDVLLAELRLHHSRLLVVVTQGLKLFSLTLEQLLLHQMNTNSNDWAMIESLLFCFYSIVESCEAEGDFILPVVQILPKLDMKNPYLADTCMYTVGALAEWLMDRVEFLPVLLPIVMPGLQVANSSILGFSSLLPRCRDLKFQIM